MKAWKISGGIVLLLYVVISVFICIRKVDGAGIVQTPEMRNITLIILQKLSRKTSIRT